ncbi:dnaJ homolog subfamily B member 9-like isoform X2 [Paramacrobiotus metropolitanus]|uniref:dnaJ homolog subfamily B member 9-like isoform X2 n=1 Tax=Paramacrobiotus metropolitanus TaxID=2943436 RepID=UPI002445D150|nr:dnaJ homolog subfamily B member 9-like isoform X2 [Paramacrobiotus metropolitanus]
MDLVRMPYRHIFCWPFHSTSLKLAGGFVHKVRFITSTDIIPARHFTSCSRFPTQPRASLCGVIFIQPRRFVSRSPGARNFYDVLEINQQASPADIKAAYYKLSKQYHPDINQAGDAVKKFREITEAYEILGNTKSRETYDTNLRGGHTTTDTSYQSGSAARQRNRYTETDFNDFEERYRQFRAQAFGRRKGAAPPTGKTEYYDYDEFYRQHYQAFRGDNQEMLEDTDWV